MTTLTKEAVKQAGAKGRKYRLADSRIRGLFLRVSAAGIKTYIILYRDRAGVQRESVVGRADVVSLEEARAQAKRALGDLTRGIDPIQTKEASRTEARRRRSNTLGAFIADWETVQCLKGKRESTRNWESAMLRNHVTPRMGDLPLGDIRRADVLDLMEHVATHSGLPNSNKVHTLLTMLLNAAVDRELIISNPALGVKKLYKPQPRERILDDKELRDLWEALREAAKKPAGDATGFHPTTARALQICLLTGQRRGEVAGSAWKEIDIDAKLWRIPKERVKNKKNHVVPLSALAVDILKESRTVAVDSPWVFPAPASSRSSENAETGHIPGMALRTAICRLAAERDWPSLGPHDLRRTMATRMAEDPIQGSSDVIGRILNHTPQGVTRQVYVRADYLPQARQLVEAWAQLIQQLVGADSYAFGRANSR